MATCGFCSGTGKVTCTGCGGRGSIIHVKGISPCIVCGGTGMMRCDPCGGTGQMDFPSRRTGGSDPNQVWQKIKCPNCGTMITRLAPGILGSFLSSLVPVKCNQCGNTWKI